MRIIHYGGIEALVASLVEEERLLGLASESCGGAPNDSFLAPGPSVDLPHADKGDVLIVHGFFSLAGALGVQAGATLAKLTEYKSRGVRVMYWSQGDEPLASSQQRAKAKVTEQHLQGAFNYVLLSSLEALPLAKLHGSYTWISLPAPPQFFERGGPREYKSSQFRFKAILSAYQTVPPVIKGVLEAIQREKLLLDVDILSPETAGSLDAFAERVQASDLLIEAADRSTYGPLGIGTMALARPLFCGLSEDLRKEWPSQELCPAIAITSATIAERLRHTLKEPRMLRDLGKRGRAFALERHHPKRVAAMTQQLYLRLQT